MAERPANPGGAGSRPAGKIQPLWDALPSEQREAIEQQVRGCLGKTAPESFVRRLCLEELARRLDGEQE